LGVTESEAALNAFNWIKHNPLHLWKDDLHLTIVHVPKHVGSGDSLLRRYEHMAADFAKTVSTKLLPRQKSVGKTLKEFMSSLQQPLLVLGCTRQKWKVIDYCVQRCECPVMVVKKDYSAYSQTRPNVALAMDVNVHCDRTFTWLLKQAELPETSQLFVVHITPKKSDKPDARRFLASLKPKCMESKRMYSMASALVSYDRGTVSDGIIKFCHDKEVATLLIASKGDRRMSRIRLSNSITDDCLRNSPLDVMVWMDEQTRNVSGSPYIYSFEGSEPTPLNLAPWEDNSSPVVPEIQDTTETKSKSFPRQPGHPRSMDTPYHPDSLPPITDDSSSTVIVSGKKQRRRNSLKYYVYDQIAKGKNQLSKFSDDNTLMEPLSP